MQSGYSLRARSGGLATLATLGLVLAACTTGVPTAAPAQSGPAPTAASKAAPPASGQSAPGGASLFKSDYNAIVAAAQQEGQISVCTTADEATEWPTYLAGFKALFPNIKVDYTLCTGVDTRQRVLTELQAGKVSYDTFDAADELLQQFSDAGVLAKPDWNVFKGTPLEIDPRNIAQNFDGQFVAAGTWSGVIAYNKNLVAADRVPKTWQECADPAWNGKGVLVDTRPQSFLVFYKTWGTDKLRAFAKSLATINPTWVRGSKSLAGLAAGEYPMWCGVQLHTVARAMKLNPNTPLAVAAPSEVATPFLHKMAIAKATKAPNAALLFAAYLASQPGQTAIANANWGYGSVFDPSSEKSKWLKQFNATAVSGGWDYATYADDASQLIVEAWGFPKATDQ